MKILMALAPVRFISMKTRFLPFGRMLFKGSESTSSTSGSRTTCKHYIHTEREREGETHTCVCIYINIERERERERETGREKKRARVRKGATTLSMTTLSIKGL
jgi:hypothetical protein